MNTSFRVPILTITSHPSKMNILLLLLLLPVAFSYTYDCLNAQTAAKFFSCQCHFLHRTGASPVEPGVVFTPEQIHNFLLSCQNEFGTYSDMRNGCIMLSGSSEYDPHASADAMTVFVKQCFSGFNDNPVCNSFSSISQIVAPAKQC